MDDLSDWVTGISAGSSMAQGGAAPVPEFGQPGSDSQHAAPVLPVPDAADASPVDSIGTEWGTPVNDSPDLWQYAQGVNHG